jgi:hypothetical protein
MFHVFFCSFEQVDEKGEHKANDMYMTEEEYAGCFEKPSKKKGGKRKRSPSPSSTPIKNRKGPVGTKG